MENQEKTNVVKKPAKQGKFSAVRVSNTTQRLLTRILAKGNKKNFGTKVKSDSVIALGLSLITDEHIKELQENTISQKDRFEMYFQKVSKQKGISKEKFFELLLSGKLDLGDEKNLTSNTEKVEPAPMKDAV